MADHPDLETFLDAYIRTALWSSHDNANESGGEPFDANYSSLDLNPDTAARMRADCARFLAENDATLRAAVDTGAVRCGPDFDEAGRAGHDFWLTRNGHGAGFWDGDWPEPQATELTKASKAFGETDLYLGDDGAIHAS